VKKLFFSPYSKGKTQFEFKNLDYTGTFLKKAHDAQEWH